MANESVLNGVRKYLRALQDQGMAVKFGVIFGSQVAGNTDAWSDIDLLVVSHGFDDQHKAGASSTREHGSFHS
jgi:predicted nucleotidyltransferase